MAKRKPRKKPKKIYGLDEYSLKEIIMDRLEKMGASKYDLANNAGVTSAPSTTFRYLSDNGTNTFSGCLEELLQACGLAVVVVDPEPKWLIGE